MGDTNTVYLMIYDYRDDAQIEVYRTRAAACAAGRAIIEEDCRESLKQDALATWDSGDNFVIIADPEGHSVAVQEQTVLD